MILYIDSTFYDKTFPGISPNDTKQISHSIKKDCFMKHAYRFHTFLNNESNFMRTIFETNFSIIIAMYQKVF